MLEPNDPWIVLLVLGIRLFKCLELELQEACANQVKLEARGLDRR